MAIIILTGKQGKYQFDPAATKPKEGGTGLVYLGTVKESYSPDLRVGTRIAIKVLDFSLKSDIFNIIRIEREATIQVNHPNLLRMYDYIEWMGKYHAISEWLDGETLDVRLHTLKMQGLKLPFVEVNAVLEALLSGLECLHSLHPPCCHRDVKPGNLMLGFDGKIKLIDFGIAKVLNSPENNATVYGTILGTPAYAAPEQLRGHHDKISPASDIYALGNVLYELLLGRQPFSAEDQLALMNKQVDEPIPDLEDLPEPFRQVIEKATYKKPEDRFQSIAEVRQALKSVKPEQYPEKSSINWLTARDHITHAIWLFLLGVTVLVIFVVARTIINEKKETISREDQARFEILKRECEKALEPSSDRDKACHACYEALGIKKDDPGILLILNKKICR